MRADAGRFDRQPAGVDEQDILDLELQRLTRDLLDHLTAMFPQEEAADLRRAMAAGAGCDGPYVVTSAIAVSF